MTRMERRRRQCLRMRIRMVSVTAVLLAVTFAVMWAANTEAAEKSTEINLLMPTVTAMPVLLASDQPTISQEAPSAEPVLRNIEELEPAEEANENELIEQALLEQGYFHEEIPLDYDLQAHLIAVCEEYGVPTSVALGVIQAESTFTATAQNGSCYGYMQINSINSEWLNERLGVTDLTDPYQNIRSGVYILSDLYGKYGDWHKALTCYNFGEVGAQKHVFSQGHTTTTYSRTVMAYAEEWEKVLG